jgi:hypothetical protein
VETTPRQQRGAPRVNRVVRPVTPPVAVVIDLGAMYGHQPHWRHPHVTNAAMLHLPVVGYLDAWVLGATGWFGACRYRVKLGAEEFAEQRHLVPGWMIRRASDSDVEQARMRGDLRRR